MTSSLENWVAVRLSDVADRPDLSWALGQTLTLPLRLLREGQLREDGSGGCRLMPMARATTDEVRDLRLAAAFTDRPPLSSRLPFSYQRIPPLLRSLVARCMGNACKGGTDWARFPGWPLDLSADFLADLAGEPSRFRSGPTPVILSHDLDSHEGLCNFLEHFAPLEEAVGARSANYVPAQAWTLDRPRLDEVRRRGHEIGVHGFDHSNRSAFLAEARLHKRLEASRLLRECYGATGYRAPSLLRTRRLLRALGAEFQYDSSIPTSGGRFPTPNNGCASARPFLCEGIIELPLSMPRDGSLLFLGHTPKEILAIWMQCAERIAASGGVIVHLNHCEPRFSGNPAMLEIYGEFLQFLAGSGRYAFATTQDVLARLSGQP